jgi:preprotein translocase subunit SecE
MNKISAYFRDSYRELVEKVTWPSWTQLQQTTMIVLAATLVITVVVFGMDAILANEKFGIMKVIYKILN